LPHCACPAKGNTTACPNPQCWLPGNTCGSDIFFNFSVNDAAAFYSSATALRLQDPGVSGFFIDDTQGLGTEHFVVQRTGMTAAQVAAWNEARLPVYSNVTANLLAHGKYSWSLLRDANVRGPPNTNGGIMMPTNVSCAAWMRQVLTFNSF